MQCCQKKVDVAEPEEDPCNCKYLEKEIQKSPEKNTIEVKPQSERARKHSVQKKIKKKLT